jgi:UDP-N-acetylglucosamine 1-carboxyvinyltransferase
VTPATTSVIWELEGGAPLRGSIRAQGAKNAATKELVASLLTSDACTFHNVPEIAEIDVTLDILSELGAELRHDGSTIEIATPQVTGAVSEHYSGLNRVPILLLGPLLNRVGEATVPMVGGCKIGKRPIDFHMAGLEAMGAEITVEGSTMVAKASQLVGCRHRLPYPSVGATENLILAAVGAKGTTVIENAAIEPEIIDLLLLLQKMGAHAVVEVDRRILIEGVDRLQGSVHHVIEDRIEIASYAAAAVATGGDIEVVGANQAHLMSFLNFMRRIGGQFTVTDRGMRFWGDYGKLQPRHLETDVHPGFMTDWQQPAVVVLTQAEGVSVVHETVYENRFGYTELLRTMGARIELSNQCLGQRTCRFVDQDFPHSAVVSGPSTLLGRDLAIPDLRAGFSYVLAGLLAQGRTRLHNVWYLERGYEDIPGKLGQLGISVQVTESTEPPPEVLATPDG